MNDFSDEAPSPTGELMLQTVAMPADTNPRGDIFAGWLVSQMDIAGAILAIKVARGRVVTVAIDSMHFLTSVHVGAVVSCYASLVHVGTSSLRVAVEVWINDPQTFDPIKVTESEFVFVLLDEQGRTKAVQTA